MPVAVIAPVLASEPVSTPTTLIPFPAVAAIGPELVTSPVTLAECLVHPLRRDLTIQAEQYKQLILHGVGTEFSGIGPEAAERAAGLRASHSISLIDAFQLGVAIHTGCQAFLTNDRRLSKIVDVPVLLLDDLEA